MNFKEILLPHHPHLDLHLKFRRDSIEIRVIRPEDEVTIARAIIEDLSRLKEAMVYLGRRLPATFHNGVWGAFCPAGVTYTPVKPTTGKINFIHPHQEIDNANDHSFEIKTGP